VAAKSRQIETEAAPIRYVAELVGADTDSERAIRWLIALMVLCCDPLAIALTPRLRRAIQEKKRINSPCANESPPRWPMGLMKRRPHNYPPPVVRPPESIASTYPTFMLVHQAGVFLLKRKTT